MKTLVTALSVSFLLSGCIIHVGGGGGQPLQHIEKTLALEANQLDSLVADTGAGSLLIQAEAGRTAVEVIAQIYYHYAVTPVLTLQQSGRKALLEAEFDGSNFSQGQGPYIDLVIKVPPHFGLQLDDGSGDINIQGLAGALVVHDGSGELRIDGGASLMLEDGSGDLHITNIHSTVNINDGSGDLSVENVAGVVTIDDGSGDILVRKTGGLTITDAGSGDLTVDAINGPVSLSND